MGLPEDATITTVSKALGNKHGGLARVKVYDLGLYQYLNEDPPRRRSRSASATSPESAFTNLAMSARALRRAKKLAEKREREHAEELKNRRFEQRVNRLKKMHEEQERRVKEKVEMNVLRKEERFQAMYKDVADGQALSSEVKYKIQLLDEASHIKTIKQYEDWNDLVYGQFQRAIENAIRKMDYRTLNRRRCKAYQAFLDQTNKKPNLFRDIFASDYDPMVLNRHCVKVRCKELKDPSKRAVQRTEEEQAILAHVKPKSRPSSKVTLDVQQWAKGKIEDTPHGFFAKLMRDERGPESASATKARASSIVFDHYNVAQGKEAVLAECPKGIRVFNDKKIDHLSEQPSNEIVKPVGGVKVFPDKLGHRGVELG